MGWGGYYIGEGCVLPAHKLKQGFRLGKPCFNLCAATFTGEHTSGRQCVQIRSERQADDKSLAQDPAVVAGYGPAACGRMRALATQRWRRRDGHAARSKPGPSRLGRAGDSAAHVNDAGNVNNINNGH